MGCAQSILELIPDCFATLKQELANFLSKNQRDEAYVTYQNLATHWKSNPSAVHDRPVFLMQDGILSQFIPNEKKAVE